MRRSRLEIFWLYFALLCSVYTKFGTDPMAHLQETSFCVIGIALLCMNLAKRLRSLLRHFLQICLLGVLIPDFKFMGFRSRL